MPTKPTQTVRIVPEENPATKDEPTKTDACVGSSSDLDAIAACTQLIDSRRFQGTALAKLYYERGMKYRFRNSYRLAVADLDRAIRLAPSDGEIVWGRGCTRIAMGDKRGGRADVARAKTLGFELDKEAPCGL